MMKVAIVTVYTTIIVPLVLRVQFASNTFSGVESAGEMFATIVIIGGIPNMDISANVSFSEINATG